MAWLLRLSLKIVFLSLPLASAFPGEGMWLPLLLEKYNISQMQEKGFRLSAEDIYSVSQSSIKDAVVRIGGCTGTVVSESGLILTNHHCAYRIIQSHSSVDRDYLTHGFWAADNDEELPASGLTVTFLVSMEDVSERVLSVLDEGMNDSERLAAVMEISDEIKKEAVKTTRYHAEVNAFYYGNEYYLFVYDVFEDIRLVGAPPSSIGKFGGDTDNWMWPRHTGDFAYFRIYADHENKPSGYSPDNVPYRSPVFLPLSAGEIREGDFTLVYGFPGTTSQYLTSHAVGLITGHINPHNIRLRDERLRIMGREMEISDTVRIKYASKFASISNAWKRWQGENRGLARIDAVAQKQAGEKKFTAWVESTPEQIERFGRVFPAFDSLYAELERYALPFEYGREALYAVEIVRFVNDFMRLAERFSAGSDVYKTGMRGVLEAVTESFFRDYHQPLDSEIFATMLEMYRDNIEKDFHPAFFSRVKDEFNYDFRLFADHVFSESVFTGKKDILELSYRMDGKSAAPYEDDVLTGILNDIRSVYDDHVVKRYNEINNQLTPLYRLYVEGLRMMDSEKAFYPDANRTLRVSYGTVRGYSPADAVHFDYHTTLSGVMEKSSGMNPDYDVPDKLRALYDAGDYGSWAGDGNMRVAFIASNHTTGGNSGSPVINGDGHLIGVNFDRVWEGTMSDIMFDPERCRNISVDINYILFITGRFAGALHLLEEMTIL
jgi:hypothetical protein